MSDGKMNYVLMVMWRSLNQKVRRDAIRENDGERIISHWKCDMLQFYDAHHPKYFLLGQRLLSAVHGAVSPRLRHTLKWNRTVNTHGGHGKNIAMDLQMEHFNKEYKESVKDAAGQLTEDTIARHSQMVGVGKVLRQVYEKQVSGLARSTVHKTTEVKREKDLAEFVTLLESEDFFIPHPGRSFTSHLMFEFNTVSYQNVLAKNVKSRLVKHTKIMSKRKTIILQNQTS